jgi:7,8-dihydroneopterin aldolase/epimerase/oxygenase
MDRTMNGDTIAVRGIRALGYHGVYDHEKRNGQPFVVDLVLHIDLTPAGHSDDVGDTVHYGELAQQVVGAIETEPVDLIETLAARVADLALAHPRVESVEVTVHKPEAPVGAVVDDIAVTIVRTRR